MSGTEVSATSTTGRFVGTASGSVFGAWYAEVVHVPLGGGVGARVNIRPGGFFGMALHQAEPASVVSGQFSGGTITVKDPGAHCTNQVYTVNGSLQNVSVTRTGQFVATLTHHRRSVLGRCWLYAATIGGTVTLRLVLACGSSCVVRGPKEPHGPAAAAWGRRVVPRSAGLAFLSLEDLAGYVVFASATIRLASCWGWSTWT